MCLSDGLKLVEVARISIQYLSKVMHHIFIRPVKINSMFYLSSREHFAEKPGKKTQAKKYTVLFYFAFFLIFSFADFSLGLHITISDLFSPYRETPSVRYIPPLVQVLSPLAFSPN